MERAATGIQAVLNGTDDAVQFLHDLVVPEAQDQKTPRFQGGGSSGVVLRPLYMLTAIQFDDQHGLAAGEIGDITVNRDLSPKLEAAEGAAAQMGPEPTLGVGLVSPQPSRLLNAHAAANTQSLFPVGSRT